MLGILNAVKASLPGGKVWVFTDATTKSTHLLFQVLAEALRKRVKIQFGLTGSCSPVDELYIKLAEETGGQIFFGNRDKIGEIFAPIKDSIRGDHITISRAKINLTGGSSVMHVPIDDTLENVAFSTSMYDGNIYDVKISRPNGTVVTHSDPDVIISNLGSNNQIVTVHDPFAGTWVLEISGMGPATIIVQGNSAINLEYFQFVTTVAGRYEYMYVDIPGGNPIADGKNATALTRLEGPVASYTFEIVDTDGTVLYAAQELLNDVKATTDEIVLTIAHPGKLFSVMARGITSAGYEFQRLALRVYVPQGIKVSFDERSRPVAIPEGSNTTVVFMVENYGAERVVLDIGVTADNMTFLHGFEPSLAEILGNSSKAINVLLAAPMGCMAGNLKLTATATDDKLLGNSHTVDITGICKPLPSSPAPSPVNSSKSSKKPTVKLTKHSSKSSKKPTVKLTKQPTKKPTVKPTKQPTKKPTVKPTTRPLTKKPNKKKNN